MERSGPDIETSRRWFLFSVSSLLFSGLLALVLCLARVPFLQGLVWDPGIFRRFLVIHVNLGLGVWLHTFMAALFCLLPAPRSAGPAGWFVSLAGVVLMIASGFARSAAPVLSNYVPVLAHPLFLAGLVIFWGGIALVLIGGGRLLPSRAAEGILPSAAESGFRAGGLAFLIGMAVTATAYFATPQGLAEESYFEMLFWGGGHVLLFSSEAVKLGVWLVLVSALAGREPVSRGISTALFALLMAGPAASLYFMKYETAASEYRQFFTEIMRWGIFPVSLAFLGFCIAALVRARHAGFGLRLSDVRTSGFLASALLTVLGFVFGAFIRSPSTLVPAHYHASMGAVTVAFMTMAFVLLPVFGFRIPERWESKAALQPAIFGIGQALFAAGFAMAGAVGMGRKIYGQEQQVKGMLDYAGLAVMGLGGVIAVAGGILFLAVIIAAVRGERRVRTIRIQEEFAWRTQRHIPSRG